MAALGASPLACGGTLSSDDAGTAKGKPKCTENGAAEGGIVSCTEGYSYKATSTRCQPGQIDPRVDLPPLTGSVDCTADESACNAFRLSYCGGTELPSASRHCQTGCASDADCSDGAKCECLGAAYGVCTFSYCDSDADCEPGYHCASSNQGCGSSAFRCQSAEDECFGSADCGGNGSTVCQDNGSGPRQCGAGSVCGRPFLVQSAPRLAMPEHRSDWLTSRAPQTEHLSGEEREALAAHWTEMGRMEHASIAAFARFQLQLLALGAPADLVTQCNQALVDETEHARLCFGLASAYAARPIGPGALDIARSLEASSLLEVVELVLAEGCFGETGAALEALEATQSATDPVVRSAYARIAGDEQRHAELAFRFVRWALLHDREGVQVRISRALQRFAHHPAHPVAEPCLFAILTGAERSVSKCASTAPANSAVFPA